jgi:hypothetical protein
MAASNAARRETILVGPIGDGSGRRGTTEPVRALGLALLEVRRPPE